MSIIDLVDEVILIDNLSTDSTPDIFDRLQRKRPGRVTCCQYPHEVCRVGRESWQLASGPTSGSSPRLSANYYNWCLERCSNPYVLKWDGDMVALPVLGRELSTWRDSNLEALVFFGANVHPKLTHLVKAGCTDREALLEKLSVPALPLWVTSLTYDYPEPRLFPKASGRYTSDLLWTQKLSCPPSRTPGQFRRPDEPCYLHMKFCKRIPCANYTDDLSRVINSVVDLGPRLPADWRQVLVDWGVNERTHAVPRGRPSTPSSSSGSPCTPADD